LKAWSDYLGLAGGHVRTPLLELSAAEREDLRRDLDRLALNQPEGRASLASAA
jgi:dihydrodipicolinate synthase/N-acetylneuraminate lyase